MMFKALARSLALILLILSLGGCSMLNSSTPAPLPTVVLDSPASNSASAAPSQPARTAPTAEGKTPASGTSETGAPAGGIPSTNVSGGVTASAEVVPAQTADLGFASLAYVKAINVSEGDQVKAGDVLASQDNLAELQSAVDAAKENLASARKTYDQLLANAPVARANAQLALVRAQKALDDAQKASNSKQFQRASQETIDIARARLIQANQALDDAEKTFGSVSARSNEDVAYAAGLAMLAKARQEQTTAQYNLDYVMGLPSPLDIEEAAAVVSVAQSNLLAAKQAWEQVKDGELNEQDDAVAQARISAAQSGLDTAQLALDRAVLHAPFDGTIISLAATPGQAVNPGQAILTLANLKTLQVETTDLSERDISLVKVGQPATVTIEGMKKDFPGRVVKIAPRATKVGGDVVYKVTIQLNRLPDGLRWGMSATVRIGS